RTAAGPPAARGAPPRGAAGGSGPASPAQLDEAAGQLRQPGGLLPPCWEGAQPVGHRAASAPTREHEGFRSAPPAPLLAAAGPAVAAPPAEAAPVAPPQVSDADLSASLRRRREELAALGRGPRRFLVRTQLGFLNVHREPGDPIGPGLRSSRLLLGIRGVEHELLGAEATAAAASGGPPRAAGAGGPGRRSDNVVGRLLEGEIVVGLEERGGWLRHDRGGWSVRFFGGFEWLQPIEEDGTAS
ncbi:unnamed protein product, partial [Prorocentrum cordatum]